MLRKRPALGIVAFALGLPACGLFFSHDDFDPSSSRSSNTFTIRGTINGLESPEQRVGLAINGGDVHELTNGAFEITTTTLRLGERYALESRTAPAGIGCLIENGTGERGPGPNDMFRENVVVHCGGNDAFLKSIVVSNAEPFAFEPLRLDYSIRSVLPKLFSSSPSSSQTLTVEANQASAKLTLLGDDGIAIAITSGAPVPWIDVGVASSTKTIRVTPVIGAPRDYHIKIDRRSTRELEPPFDAPELGFGVGITTANTSAKGTDAIAVRAPSTDETKPGDNVFVYERSAAEDFVPTQSLRRTRVAVPASPGFTTSTAMVMEEDTLVVGTSDRPTEKLSNAGAAHVFVRTAQSDGGGGGDWQHRAVLGPIDAVEGRFYGVALAIRGDILTVGAPQNAGEQGAFVDVFRRIGGEWTRHTALVAEDGDPTPFSFGRALAVLGDDTIIVGAPTGDSGAVYVFERKSLDSKWAQTQKIVSPQGAPNLYGHFGSALAADNDILVVGEPHDDPLTPQVLWRPGAAHVFRRDPTTRQWHSTVTLKASVPPTQHQRDAFGRSVALRGDFIAVGAGTYLSPPTAYLFQRDAQVRDVFHSITAHRESAANLNSQVASEHAVVALGVHSLIVGVPRARRAFALY